MSSIVAASAASPSNQQKPVVVRRELLWQGGTIEIVIPLAAKEGQYPSDTGVNKFLSFFQSVKGGVVFFFYHGGNLESARGTKVIVDAEIWRKTLDNKKKYLYVDLDLPADSSKEATHRLAAMSAKKKDLALEDDFATFQTPKPLEGVIVIAPVESKIRFKTPAPKAEAKKPETAAPLVTPGTVSEMVSQLAANKGWNCGRLKVA